MFFSYMDLDSRVFSYMDLDARKPVSGVSDQTSLLSYKDKLENRNFARSKS